MRIRSLGLKRYGRFTDVAIDFGETTAGVPDLHIVYGPNESGKSTAVSAFLDLLFGILPQSKFNFLHPYAAMRIDADVEQSGQVRRLSRIKRSQNSLLGDSEQPVPDTALLGNFGGLDRGAYQTMFCLDDETLEAGGESILASRGDLGHLLFSATAGLADLSQRLDTARSEADAFFRQGKRSGELVDLKKELTTLKEDRDKIDTLASEHARLTTERDGSAKEYDKAIAQRGRTLARIDEIQRLLNALPRLGGVRRLRQELEPLAGLPDIPDAWASELPGLMTEEIRLATQDKTNFGAIEELKNALASTVVNVAASALESRIELLTDLRARYITAEKDLPSRRLQLGIANQAIVRILQLINQSAEIDPERLILTTLITGPIRDLMEKRSGVDTSVAAAQAEFTNALSVLDEAEARLGDAGNERDDTASRALAAAIATAREGDEAGRYRAANRLRLERAEEFADRVLELRPWQGDQETLLSLTVPTPVQIENWSAAEASLTQAAALQRANFDRLTDEAKRLDARSEALGSVGGVISDQEAREVRAVREAAWASHKAALDTATASSFEATMRRDDFVMDQRFAKTSSVAELNLAMLERVDVKTSIEQASKLLQDTIASRAAVAREIAQSLCAIGGGMDEGMGLAGLKLWLQKRDRAIEMRAKLMIAERELRHAQDDAASSREKIVKALRTANVQYSDDDDIVTLLAAGQAAIDRDTDTRALLKAVDDRRRDLKSRETIRNDALEAERAWNRAWHDACAACWLGESGRSPTITTVRETLDAVAELGAEIEKKAELTDRIAKMERDQTLFLSEVEKFASNIDLAFRPADALGLCQAVMSSVADATIMLNRRQEIEERLDAEQKKGRRIAEEMAVVDARKKQMIEHFGVTSLLEVDVRLHEVARKIDLTKRLADARLEVLETLGVETIEVAEAQLDTMDRGALEAELQEKKALFDDLDQRSRDLFSSRNKAEDNITAVGGDAAVAILDEKRRTVALLIEDKAIAHLKLRLGALAADRALRAYRDRHRSSMMTRASESFSLISRGAYSGLATHPMNDSEILIANGSDGTSKVASELSKGTRFQLYLALRVAGYHEFARSHSPAPFLADDIMETFDDFRAEEAFRLLAGMSTVGQVVYFTHHRHLCEIVKVVEPRVIIHDL